jgi:outer membrane protein
VGSRLAATGLLLVGVSGCATVREARLAQDPASSVPGERTPTAAELNVPTSGTLRLADAIEVATRVHPAVVAARRAMEAAEARVGEAEAAFLPEVSIDTSAQYRNQKPGAQPSGAEKHRFHSAGLQVSWLLFDFGRTPALARRAAADWLAAQATERGARSDVVFGVRAAWYALVQQMALRDVAREAVRQFEEHLDQVRAFVEVGTRIPYDETKAEVDLGNARQALVVAEDAVLLDQANLAGAMGLAEITDWTPAADGEPPAPPPTFEEAWAAAARTRPALAAAAAREQAASALVDAQVAALWPRASLGIGASATGSSAPFPWSWQIGPSVSWTPFDGFRNLYTIDEAVAALRSARADRAQAEQQAWLETRGAWIAIEDARRRLDLVALIVRSATQNVELAQGRFEAGVGTSVELTDARQALIQAQSDEVNARADRDLATARLWRAIGAADGARPMDRSEP